MEQTKVVARKRAGSENGVAEGPSTEESMRSKPFLAPARTGRA